MKFLILGVAFAYLLYERQTYVKMKKSEFLEEHKRLLAVLKSGDRVALEKELSLQEKELKEYI